MRLLDKTKSEGGMLKALEQLRDELLTSTIPDEIRKFIPKFRTSFDDIKKDSAETTYVLLCLAVNITWKAHNCGQ